MEQLSSLYRRSVVVPKDDGSEKKLRSWYTDKNAQVATLPINTDTDFYSIYSSGMFEGLNHLCGAYIDDYEEDCIEPEQLDAAINFLRGQSYVHLSMNVETFKQQLIALLDYARLARRPVFFVF